jgi:alpha-ketoglutarate-dependent 2,4-dichlorophenoxyacetate dioxygenase
MSVAATSQGNVVIRKVHPHIGAEVLGLDLRKPIDEPSFEAVRDAFHAHSVLVFRNQNISDDQQVEFSHRFGELEKTSFAIAAPNPYIYSLSNVDDHGNVLESDTKKRNFLLVNTRWHTDSSFREIPAMASVLSGREVPRQGGDTCFASMRVGYEALAEGRRKTLEGLVGLHHYAYSLSLFGDSGVSQEEKDALPAVAHPLVRTHKPTGRKSLYVSGHIERLVGMPVEEGCVLVKELIDWCTRPEFVYQHQWQQHDLVMWDNRCTLHRATLIPEVERRIMHRTTIAGEGPVE